LAVWHARTPYAKLCIGRGGDAGSRWTLLDTFEWIRGDASKWRRGGSNHVRAELGSERSPVGANARRIEL
jgi:hypothetical protein